MKKKIKRLLDIIVSSALLIGTAPVTILTAILIKLTMGNPVFFCQLRPGYKEQIFTLYKFRTMTEERDAKGEPLPDEKRQTKLGEFIRSLSIDELPQFWNVLKGDLSVIGPRPLLVEYLVLYTPEQHRRHGVMPGIIGLPAVTGRRLNSWERRFELDLWYVDHWSLWLDLKIFLMAFHTVFSRSGVKEIGSEVSSKYMGSDITRR